MAEKNLIWRLKQVNLSLEQFGRLHLRQRNMSPSQCLLLDYMLSQEENAFCATALHEEFGISKAALSSILKGLKQMGYLEIVSDPTDDRKKRIFLTSKACEEQKRIVEEMEESEALLCRGFSQEEKRGMEEYLDRMLFNLKKERKENRFSKEKAAFGKKNG